jgi:hypothetical protein
MGQSRYAEQDRFGVGPEGSCGWPQPIHERADGAVDQGANQVGDAVQKSTNGRPPENQRCERPEGGTGENVAWVMDPHRHAAHAEDRRECKHDSAPCPVSQHQGGGDGERGGRVVARKAGVGDVTNEQVHAVRVGDEWTRTIDNGGEHMRDRQRDARAEAGSRSRASRASAAMTADEHERRYQHAGEQELGGIDVGDHGILDTIVMKEEVVQRVQQGRVHRHRMITGAGPRATPYGEVSGQGAWRACRPVVWATNVLLFAVW